MPVLFSVLLPSAASAQEPAAPALPDGVAPIADERPMRFFLTGGNTFVATRIGEDTEFFWVRGADGALARVRKSDIARLSYQLAEPPAPRPRAPVRPPSLDHLDDEDDPQGRSPPGKGLVVGGSVLAGVFYGGTLLFAPSAKGPGELLLIPVFGPVVYGLARNATMDDVGGLAIVSLLQGAGVLMIYLGLRQMSAARDNRRQWTEGLVRPTLVLVPDASRATVGLAAIGAF